MKRLWLIIFLSVALSAGSALSAEETPEEALARLEAQGVTVDSLRLKAEIAEAAGKNDEALDLYDAAIGLYLRQNRAVKEPPLDLAANQKRLFNLIIEAKGEAAYAKPEQTAPPDVIAAAQAGEDPPSVEKVEAEDRAEEETPAAEEEPEETDEEETQ